MQKIHESILRAINNTSKKYNILTFPTHERYQANLSSLPHSFYMWKGQGIKHWNSQYAEIPQNHTMLDGSDFQIRPDIKFDMILSQNKYGQFQVAHSLAIRMNLPIINIEHTLPHVNWTNKHVDQMKQMRGNINAFISEYSIDQWGFDKADQTVRIVRHAIDTEKFKPKDDGHNDGKILTVANDYIGREWCLCFSLFKSVCLDNNMPTNPVGDTPGLSKPAKDIDDLVSKYQNASVFFNTSKISPVPMSLLEAMSCGNACVSTATCMIPEIIEDGVNGFISNDPKILKDRLEWCLKNPEDARKIGKNARNTIVERFNLKQHLDSWNSIFDEVYGKGYHVFYN